MQCLFGADVQLEFEMGPSIADSHVEEAALSWLGELGYSIVHGPDIAPGEPAAERDSFGNVVLVRRLQQAIASLNVKIPAQPGGE